MLTFPLSLAQFSDLLPMATLTPRQGLQQQLSSQGSGLTIAADLAPAQPEYDVVCAPIYHSEAAPILAMLDAFRGPMNSFYISDPRWPWPQADPGGTLLASYSPEINSINDNNQALSLKGLPAGYVITAGDFLSWDYGTDPTRRAYFRSVETVTANGSGVTPEFQINDFIQAGSSALLPVTLVKPAMKAKLIAGSVQEQAGGDNDGSFTTIQFSVRQTL